jgi:hypothetical protein
VTVYQYKCERCATGFTCTEKHQRFCSLKCSALSREKRATAPEKRKRQFDKNFHVTPGCWVWTGRSNRQQYGEFVYGDDVLAHRVAYRLYVGPIPAGMCILHRCDNPSCVNPGHLSVGTRVQNLEDMTEKGRRVRGVSHGMAKLTEAVVLSIRSDPRASRAIAAECGVSPATISLVRARKTWAHL